MTAFRSDKRLYEQSIIYAKNPVKDSARDPLEVAFEAGGDWICENKEPVVAAAFPDWPTPSRLREKIEEMKVHCPYPSSYEKGAAREAAFNVYYWLCGKVGYDFRLGKFT